MTHRLLSLPAFTHKTVFPCGNVLLNDDKNALSTENLQRLLRRHTSGDWGDVPRKLRLTNHYALEYDNSLLSCYFHPFNGIRMVVINTCADRSETVISVHP